MQGRHQQSRTQCCQSLPPTQDLFDGVHAKLRAGKPGFHHARYKVYENHFHNIPARGEGEVGPHPLKPGVSVCYS